MHQGRNHNHYVNGRQNIKKHTSPVSLERDEPVGVENDRGASPLRSPKKRQMACEYNSPALIEKFEPPKKLTSFSSSPVRNNAEEPPGHARPASETRTFAPEDLQKLKKAHYPYHSIHLAKHDCSRPVTRRNPSDMPDIFKSRGHAEEIVGADEFENTVDDDKETPDEHDDIDWGDLKEVFSRRQSGCNASAVHAGGDETCNSLGLRDVGYLEIWAFDDGQQLNQSGRRHKERKSVSAVYTVLPIVLDSGNESSDNAKKPELCSKKVTRCDRKNCSKLLRKREGGALQKSISFEHEDASATETCTSESEIETSKQDRDSDANSKQHVEINSDSETPSRPKPPGRSKTRHRDSIFVTNERRQRSQTKNLSRGEPRLLEAGGKSPSDEIPGTRKSSSIEKPERRKSTGAEESEQSSEDAKKSCAFRGVIDHEYLQFSLRITEDIIRNDLYNNDEMKRVFNSHIEANRGRLDMAKMKGQIKNLCAELGVAYDDTIGRPSCREDVGKLQENLKNIMCFSAPRKDPCLPCNAPENGASPEPELTPPEKQSQSAGQHENKMDTPTEAPETIVEPAPPSQASEKQLRPHRNKTGTPAKLPSLKTEPVPQNEATPTVTGEKKQLRSASPHRNKTGTPTKLPSLKAEPVPQNEVTPTVIGQTTPTGEAESGADKNITAPPTTPVTPTRAGPERRSSAKTRRGAATIGESDGHRKIDDVKEPSGEIKKLEPYEAETAERKPKSICSVCCPGQTVCLEENPLSLYENPLTSSTDAPTSSLGSLLPTAPPPDDAQKLPKPNVLSVASRAEQPRKLCEAEKTRWGTGIPALDETLKKYDLEMLAQSSFKYEYHAQTDTPEFYKRNFLPPQKPTATTSTTTDEYVVVSGPVYIPAHFIGPHCNCAPYTPQGRTRKDLLLTNDYNCRTRPDISMFYPNVSTQTSSTDFALSDQARSASGYKTFSSERMLLDDPTPPLVISSKDFAARSKDEGVISTGALQVIETPKVKQKVKKEPKMEVLVAVDEEEKHLDSVETLNGEEGSEMFIIEHKPSKEDSDHLKHKVNQIINMTGDEDDDESNASSESNSDARSSLDRASRKAKEDEEKEKKKEVPSARSTDNYMKKLDQKPDMSMTSSMTNSIKKVNRDSQQFRNPDDKRITWGNRRLKIKKLTDSDSEIGVIREEEEEPDPDRHSNKSENSRVDVA